MHQSALLASNWRDSSTQGSIGRGRCNPPAQWNMPAKMSTKCFWNACKALSIGLLLMLIGGSMATIGYYADQHITGNETRGNISNVWVKHDSRGFHLNNLSYAGPIVMGVGGFIVVAACVMTFEARDSAAKVAAARGKPSQTSSHRQSKHSPREGGSKQTSFKENDRRKASGSQLNKWEYGHKGRGDSFVETSSGPRSPLSTETMSRRALTAAFVQFSKNLQQTNVSKSASLMVNGINRSPSAPNLIDSEMKDVKFKSGTTDSPILYISPKSSQLIHHMNLATRNYIYQQKRDRSSINPSNGCALLNPHSLLKRQAISVDIPDYCSYFSPPRTPQHVSRQGSGRSESHDSVNEDVSFDNSLRSHENQLIRGSQGSMAMDLHLPNDCPVTLKIKDRNRQDKAGRSPNFTKRNLLRRQTQIEHTELEISPKFLQELSELQRPLSYGRQDSVTRVSPRSSFDYSKGLRSSDVPRDSIAGMVNQKYKYSRAKTFDETSTSAVKGKQRKNSVSNRGRRKSDDKRRSSNPTVEASGLLIRQLSSTERRSPSYSTEISPSGSTNIDLQKPGESLSDDCQSENRKEASKYASAVVNIKHIDSEELVGPSQQTDKTDSCTNLKTLDQQQSS